MKVVGGVVAMAVGLGFQADRDEAHLTVLDAALRDDAIGELPHRPGFSAKHRDFQAILMVEMHMECGDVEMMVIVMRAGEPLWKFASVVVEHVRQRREALAAALRVQPRMLQAQPGKVPQCF